MFVDLVVDSDDSGTDCRSLLSWLVEDSSTREIEVRLASAAAGEDMGFAGEFVRILLEPGGPVVAVASAVGGWLVSRSGRARLRIRRGDNEVEIEAPKVRDVERIEEAIRRGLGGS